MNESKTEKSNDENEEEDLDDIDDSDLLHLEEDELNEEDESKMNKFDPIKFLVERLREINLNKNAGNKELDFSLENEKNNVNDINNESGNDVSAKNMDDLGDIE